MAAEDEVRQASEQFYAALNRTLDVAKRPPREGAGQLPASL
jgi:hypothetical protein